MIKRRTRLLIGKLAVDRRSASLEVVRLALSTGESPLLMPSNGSDVILSALLPIAYEVQQVLDSESAGLKATGGSVSN